MLEPAADGSDLLDQIRDDVFEDRVYAISPRGDVVELSANATPLDFAYHVHTQVGHRCRGAKINGRIVPLTYQIKNGDQVEIITGSQPQPSRDWLSPKLGYLAGARSRAKVRNWFRHQDRDQHLRQGRDILERELARLGVRDVTAGEIATQLKQPNADTLCVALGAGGPDRRIHCHGIAASARRRAAAPQPAAAHQASQDEYAGYRGRERYRRPDVQFCPLLQAGTFRSTFPAISHRAGESAFIDRTAAISSASHNATRSAASKLTGAVQKRRLTRWI